ncbi:MAG: hypothetical protein ACRDV4_10630, partial [Acidimicrobiales bacterium]
MSILTVARIELSEHAEAASAPSVLARTPHRASHAKGHAGPKKVRRVLSLFLSVLVTIVMVLAAVLAVASHLSSKNQYEVFGHPVLSVLSGSMTPAIRTGDLVIDDPVTSSEASSLHVGQIITFKNPAGRDA